jgi:uncharacterized protein (TIRG00374 family)
VAVALLARAILTSDLSKVGALLREAGPGVAVIGLPYLVAVMLDTAAFTTLFGVLGRRVRFARLLGVRLSAEAVTMSLPAGAVFAESLNPMLLKARCDVPVEHSVAGMAARKWLQMRAHSIYIAASAVVGFGVLSACSRALVHFGALPWVVLASAAVPLSLSVGMSSAFRRGRLAEKALALLARFPNARLRTWLEARRAGFHLTDSNMAAFGERAAGRSVAAATLLYVGAWLMESIETLLILRVLGANVGFVEVFSFEAGLSLVRCLVFFAPAGLGVQDLGYMAFFSALGLPDAAALGPAFVLLKRSKEIFWIAAGYAILFFAGGRPRPAVAQTAEAEAT